MSLLTDTSDYIAPDAVLAGSSQAVQLLRMQVARFGPHFRILLLTGETGSGKQFLARNLHAFGTAAALVPHKNVTHFIESDQPQTAHSLHGLAELTTAERLRVIERLRLLPREARVILTCGADSRGISAATRFKAEALGKVGLLEIPVPPLRDRLEDLPAIAAAALLAEQTHALQDHHFDRLRAHTWPGNLSEFAGVFRHFLQTGTLFIDPPTPTVTAPMQPLETIISDHVSRVLEHCAGNKLRAAEILGISRSTLYRML